MLETKKFYNRLAPIYDPLLTATFALTGFDEKKYRTKMIQKLSILDKDIPILDIGCGTGRSFYLIRSLLGDHKIYGIDISDKMLEIAKKKLEEKELKNIQFIENDISNWEEIKSAVGNNYAVISALTLSVIWHDKKAVKGFLSLCRDAVSYSIMDGNWRVGNIPLKGRITKTLSVPFGIANTYWSNNNEEYLAKFLKVEPEILFNGMLFVM